MYKHTQVNRRALPTQAYSHSPSYDQSKSRTEFTYENANSNYYKNVTKISFRTTFLYFVEETPFLLFCNSKPTYLNPPSNCLQVYTPARFIFSSYDPVFQALPAPIIRVLNFDCILEATCSRSKACFTSHNKVRTVIF
jgi:hypothetical protein